MHRGVIDVKELRQAPCVPVVLSQRILELVFLLVDDLCPLPLILRSEDPARHVLGLDNKQSVYRYQYMVDLRRPVRRGKDHVVDSAVDRFIQSEPHPYGGLLLPKPALEHT